MEKRTLLAFFLSILVIIAWYAFFSPKQVPQREEGKITEPDISTQPIKPLQPKIAGQVSPGSKRAESIDLESQEIEVETEKARIILTSQGARVLHWYIKERKGDVDLVMNQKSGFLPFALRMENYPDMAFEDFKPDKDSLDLRGGYEGFIEFSRKTKDGLLIVKRFNFSSDSYVSSIQISLTNTGRKDISVENLSLWWETGLGIDGEKESLSKTNIGAMKIKAYMDKKLWKKLKPGIHQREIEWIGLSNQYFLVCMINASALPAGFVQVTEFLPDTKLPIIGLGGVSLAISPGETRDVEIPIYVGPKDYNRLKALPYTRIEEVVEFGLFGPIGKIILVVLNFLFSITHNYGWAIILLTILIYILTFPLTKKSFQSMQGMRKIQPQMNALKLKYKDDPKRLNIEMMSLYRSKKINPFSGCLPMLLQLPIFWALFMTLRSAYALRGAPFILWIQDLSIPDAAFSLPYTLPILGDTINILPLLMGITMFVQQKLTSADPSQKKMAVFFPVFLTVVLWKFPSGLILYWTTNNFLTLMGQLFIIERVSIGSTRRES